MIPGWCIVALVVVEAYWLWLLGPKLWRNYCEAVRAAQGEELIGRVATPAELLTGSVWMIYHWPVLPFILAIVVISPPIWVRFGVLMTLMVLTPAAYAVLLAWVL